MIEKSWFRNKCRRPEATLEEILLSLVRVCFGMCFCVSDSFSQCYYHLLIQYLWQSTPVYLTGESHRQRSLVGYSPWCLKELDTTEQLTLYSHISYFSFIVSHLTFHDIYSIFTCNHRMKGFPGASDGKESACNVGDPGSISGPGESHGQSSLVGYIPWGCKELDTTEQLAHIESKFLKLGQVLT